MHAASINALKTPTTDESGGGERRTPPYIFQWLDAMFHFDIDAASTDANALCRHHFTKEKSAFDYPWIVENGCGPATVWVNCPYGRGILGHWFQRAQDQAKRYGTTSVFLVYGRSDTEDWHNNIPFASELWQIKGRIAFLLPDGTEDHPALIPSNVVIFRPLPQGLIAAGPRLVFIDRPPLPAKGARNGR